MVDVSLSQCKRLHTSSYVRHIYGSVGGWPKTQAKPSPLDYLIRFLVPDVVALLAMITALREKAAWRRRRLWNTRGDIRGLAGIIAREILFGEQP